MGSSVDIDTLQSEACTGDQSATEQLFEILTSRFRMFVRHSIRNKADAEEVVQEALMAIHANHRKITFTTSFSAWACKVLEHRILDYHRRNRRDSQRFDHAVDPSQNPGAIGVDANPDLKRRLLDCMQSLCRRNLRYARVLTLHYQGYSTDEICNRMSLKPQTLYSALSKARAMLEQCLEKGGIK